MKFYIPIYKAFWIAASDTYFFDKDYNLWMRHQWTPFDLMSSGYKAVPALRVLLLVGSIPNDYSL